MDEQTIDSAADSGATDSGSGFWAGLGSALGTGLSAVAGRAINGKPQSLTPTTQQNPDGTLVRPVAAAPAINPTYLIAGGVVIVGLFLAVAVISARE